MPSSTEGGIVRDQQMLVSWRSDDENAARIKEFVEMVCNAAMRGFMEREKDEAALTDAIGS